MFILWSCSTYYTFYKNSCQWCSGSANHSPSSYFGAGKLNCIYCKKAIASMRVTICPFSGSVERVICFPCLSQYGFSAPLTQSGIFVVRTELFFLTLFLVASLQRSRDFLCCLTAFRCVFDNAYASPLHPHRKHGEYLYKYNHTTYSIFYE